MAGSYMQLNETRLGSSSNVRIIGLSADVRISFLLGRPCLPPLCSQGIS